MANDYFNHTARLIDGTPARATDVNSIFDSIVTGFDSLPSKSQMDAGIIEYLALAGTANTYTAALTGFTAYVEGEATFWLKVNVTNTGATTLNVEGAGAVAIKRADLTDLKAGDLIANAVVGVTYNGTVFVLTSSLANAVTESGTNATNAADSASAASTSASEAADSAATAAENACQVLTVNGKQDSVVLNLGILDNLPASISTNTTLTSASSTYQICTAGLTLTLPDATTLTKGGLAYLVENSSNDFVYINNDSGSFVLIIPPYTQAILNLTNNSTSDGVWSELLGRCGTYHVIDDLVLETTITSHTAYFTCKPVGNNKVVAQADGGTYYNYHIVDTSNNSLSDSTTQAGDNSEHSNLYQASSDRFIRLLFGTTALTAYLYNSSLADPLSSILSSDNSSAADDAYYMSGTRLTDTLSVVLYGDFNDLYDWYAVSVDVTGDTVTFGTPAKISSVSLSGVTKTVRVSDTRFVCAGYSSATSSVYHLLGSLVTGNFSLISQTSMGHATYGGLANKAYGFGLAISGTNLISVYSNTTNPGHLFVTIVDTSSDSLATGRVFHTIADTLLDNIEYLDVTNSPTDPNSIDVVYSDQSPDKLCMMNIKIDGTDIYPEKPQVILASGSSCNGKIANIDDNTLALNYSNLDRFGRVALIKKNTL